MMTLSNLLPILCAIALCAFLLHLLFSAINRRHSCRIYRIPEHNGISNEKNSLYSKVSIYVTALSQAEDADFSNLYAKNSGEFFLQPDSNHAIKDSFLGTTVWWKHEAPVSEKAFLLQIKKASKPGFLRPYLQHVQAMANEGEARRREPRLHTNASGNQWRSVPFKHPATFETLAMDADLKNKIKSDLEAFVKGRNYYQKLGRPWKRNYLFYGPAGTGKSSTIAAMANFLCYDVYDLQLSNLTDDSDLKLSLMQTSGRSILVVEDIDRFLGGNLAGKGSPSFSGVLNFMDGLWSSCVEERIMVFTMSSENKEVIEPIFLRPGRLDVQVCFPHCTFPAFKAMANSYLGVKDHKLFPHVKESFDSGGVLTPAEIGEILMVNKSSPSRAIKSVINALQSSSRSCKLAVNSAGNRAGRGVGFGERQSSPEEGSPENCGVIKREVQSVLELKKLYSFLRLKSGRKLGFQLNPS
ncbi:AAA-ATPase At2g46620 [Amborella trichopoda]|nr:AAA-ATPase At2g46620 [Amborella trichopoda]|eukprot:XP_006849190.2 AAA-ATPase At2g46620 [Amborella trichopoda]